MRDRSHATRAASDRDLTRPDWEVGLRKPWLINDRTAASQAFRESGDGACGIFSILSETAPVAADMEDLHEGVSTFSHARWWVLRISSPLALSSVADVSPKGSEPQTKSSPNFRHWGPSPSR